MILWATSIWPFYTESFYHKNISIVYISISVIQARVSFCTIMLPGVWVLRQTVQHSFYNCLHRLILIMKVNCKEYDSEDNIQAMPSQQWMTYRNTSYTEDKVKLCPWKFRDVVRSY